MANSAAGPGRVIIVICPSGGATPSSLAALVHDLTVPAVLVLEAGARITNHNDNSITMSGMFGKNILPTGLRLGVHDGPSKAQQRHCVLLTQGPGGISGINLYVFMQPPASDVDTIEKLGNPGWNWDTVTYLRYSRKSERFTPPSAGEEATERLHFDPAHHGTDVFIKTPLENWVFLPREMRILLLTLLTSPDTRRLRGELIAVAGQRSVDGNLLGQSRDKQTFILRGALDLDRDLALEYLNQAGTRKNLHVVVSSPVMRVLFEDEKNASGELIASGVEFVYEGKTCTGCAKREVILSAGAQGRDSAIKTPQILEFSGVGNPEILAKVGVTPRVDLAHVGENDPIADEAVLKEQPRLYPDHKGLFLLSFLGIGTGSLTRLSRDGPALTASHAARIRATPAETWRPSIAEQYALQLDKLSAGTAGLEMSRHDIHAASADPLTPPALDPHYYEEDFAREHNPGPEVQTDEELIAWIKQYTNSIAHTSGTCSMLPRDKGGVVDPRLKVYGTHNLRVVDLSILPLHIGAPTQTYVYGLAEQAADIIKGII
ncbi:hypothetical protein BJV78DRAFT_1157164 [Lactifluus subvellereus]|nr:hypothetical protein BJV78DRAFT_1157164 [Lactifluus subvellereus]